MNYLDKKDYLFIEAENFEDLGGWVVDQQFINEMGSPFLLAHGLGEPVKNCCTKVSFTQTGEYRIWVRTRDWAAPWNSAGTPGKFQVLINGKALEIIFGTEGEQWHWQNGGKIKITDKNIVIALHDLTGFEGRCDAVLFTKDLEFVPPDNGDELNLLRRKLTNSENVIDKGEFDLVVVGGGIAGICSAVTSARLGLKVALVHDRPVLGGNNSSEVRVWLAGSVNQHPYSKMGDIVNELEQEKMFHYGPENTGEIYEDDKKLALILSEKNISLFLSYFALDVQTKDSTINAVIALNIYTGEYIKVSGRLFTDCTGDGTIGYKSGADFEMSSINHMGSSNLWNVIDTKKDAPFPSCPWAIDLSDKAFPGRLDNKSVYNQYGLEALGSWFWESGFEQNPIEKSEYIRDTNFRAMYGAWDCLKNTDKQYNTYKLNWAAYISGKRESRRLLGNVILSNGDLFKGIQFDDGCVPSIRPIDIHIPDKNYYSAFAEGDAFLAWDYHESYKTPFWIPYRCLYSRNIKNLFFAGRNISVTHEALGAVRVMRTGGMMGEAVGIAASLCKKHNVLPNEVYKEHLDEFMGIVKTGIAY